MIQVALEGWIYDHFSLFSAITPSEDYIQLQTAPAPQALSPLPPKVEFSQKSSPVQCYEGVRKASPPYYNNKAHRISPPIHHEHSDSSNGSSLSPQHLQDKETPTQPTTITGDYMCY
jgi:hypothetical protein